MRSKGLVYAMIAFVAVMAVAFVGYTVLGARNRALPPAVDDTPDATAPAEPEAADDADAATQPSEPPRLVLADYDATVYTLEGDAATLTEIADGKPLVINFWATWCPYCIEELPDFQEIVNDYGDRVSFAFIDATDGRRETVEIASAWLADNGFEDLPVYYDVDYDGVMRFGVRAFPSTALVAADGTILAMESGMIDPELMRGALDTLV